MILDVDFDKRMVEAGYRATDDICECETAEISVVWAGEAPFLRFVFGDAKLFGRPSLSIPLVIEFKNDPVGAGRMFEGDKLKRHIRTTVEIYFKMQCIEYTRKAVFHAGL